MPVPPRYVAYIRRDLSATDFKNQFKYPPTPPVHVYQSTYRVAG